MLDKLDKIWVGLIFGIITPLFCFFCYWLFKFSQLTFPQGFIRYLKNGDMLQEVCIACVVFNLLIFYLILNKKAYALSKGMMYATILYVGVVLLVSLT